MNAAYSDWVRAFALRGPTLGMCAAATQEMHEAFPELERVAGFVVVPYWGKRTHWWLVAPDGSVVDPTADQFDPGGGVERYEPFGETNPAPSGKCMNCGGWLFVSTDFCSDGCEAEVVEYLRTGVL